MMSSLHDGLLLQAGSQEVAQELEQNAATGAVRGPAAVRVPPTLRRRRGLRPAGHGRRARQRAQPDQRGDQPRPGRRLQEGTDISSCL